MMSHQSLFPIFSGSVRKVATLSVKSKKLNSDKAKTKLLMTNRKRVTENLSTTP